MAGSLIKINEAIVTTATPSVTLTGIDSTYDVYMLQASGVIPVTDGVDGQLRVTKSGVVQSDLNYDFAFKGLRTDRAFSNLSSTNSSKWTYPICWSTRNTSAEAGTGGNGIIYLFNFNSSSEYSFFTSESTTLWSSGVIGVQGGGVHTVASASDGINFQVHSGNIEAGTFTLYGLKK